MRRKKQKVAIILFVTLCMGLFSGKISVQNLNAQTSSNDLYTDGQQVNVLELELPEKGIVLTEENAEIDITNLVPEKVEWKYYKNIVVDYELTQEVLSESEEEQFNYIDGEIRFVHGKLSPPRHFQSICLNHIKALFIFFEMRKLTFPCQIRRLISLSSRMQKIKNIF